MEDTTNILPVIGQPVVEATTMETKVLNSSILLTILIEQLPVSKGFKRSKKVSCNFMPYV